MGAYVSRYLQEVAEIAGKIDQQQVERIIDVLIETRQSNGRLFILGVGGGAGNATHAVNDFRKIANIESYAPTDNVSELTARVNDDGWDSSYSRWLQGSRLRKGDTLLVFSVGGGNLEKNISAKHRKGSSTGAGGWRQDHRHRGTRRRLHGQGCKRQWWWSLRSRTTRSRPMPRPSRLWCGI
jgi:phosphoheptose isomerase